MLKYNGNTNYFSRMILNSILNLLLDREPTCNFKTFNFYDYFSPIFDIEFEKN